MARRLKIKGSSVTDFKNELGAVLARKIRLDIADMNPASPYQARMKQIVKNRQVKIATVMAGYYKGTLKQLGSILNDPPFDAVIDQPVRFSSSVNVDVSSGVRGAPSSESIKIESGRDSVSSWKGLGYKYANSIGPRWGGLPVSKRFWRKTGTLAGRYHAWYAANYARLSNPASYEIGDVEGVKLTRQTKSKPGYVYTVPLSRKTPVSRWTFKITHPGLGDYVLNKLIWSSYIKGKPQRYELGATRWDTYSYVNKNGRKVFVRRQQNFNSREEQGFMRMAQPESRRPMIARYAAAMGRRELTALRKVLQQK